MKNKSNDLAYTRRVVSPHTPQAMMAHCVTLQCTQKKVYCEPFPYNFQFLDEIILYFFAGKRFHLHLLNELAIFLAKLRNH